MKQLIKKWKWRSSIYLLICVLGIFLICNWSVNAQNTVNKCRPQIIIPDLSNVNISSQNRNCSREDITITRSRAIQELAKARVIFLGETHDRDQDRKIQLKIIQELQKSTPQIAIAMEMFQIPYQDAIDGYLASKLTEKELLEQTEYEQRWGYAWESYAPILRFAKEKQLSVLAVNVPSEITRQVAKEGLDSLTPEQRKIIPPTSEIRTDNTAYRQMLAKVFEQHQHSARGNSSGFDRFFLAQVLWDETMAAEVAKFVKANPKHQVVVIAGQGHIIYGYGIPSRVARRMPQQFSQVSVLLSPSNNTATNSSQPIADYIWQ
ncbi:ChaN family lipoprotein [Chroococcidiopsis sp.]|uniref:ChaN family lipoprotein n=1 Tax=Chroococcidiopsis sp. TaxID=3088168 RepID=UPI003F367EB6